MLAVEGSRKAMDADRGQINEQLFDAVYDNNIDRAKGLLDKGASPNARGFSLVCVLIENV